MELDLQSATLGILAVVGVVNVLVMFRPESTSKEKFVVSTLVALAVSFIPLELSNAILTHVKDALVTAFAASGAYKIAQKAGGS